MLEDDENKEREDKIAKKEFGELRDFLIWKLNYKRKNKQIDKLVEQKSSASNKEK